MGAMDPERMEVPRSILRKVLRTVTGGKGIQSNSFRAPRAQRDVFLAPQIGGLSFPTLHRASGGRDLFSYCPELEKWVAFQLAPRCDLKCPTNIR